MPRAMKYLTLVVAMVGAIVVGIYVHFWIISVKLINDSGRPLSNVNVSFGHKPIWQGNISAHKSKWVLGTFDSAGHYAISYELDGQNFINQCGYVSGGPLAQSTEFEIGPDGLIKGCEHGDEPS
jgi:hypothetical protein